MTGPPDSGAPRSDDGPGGRSGYRAGELSARTAGFTVVAQLAARGLALTVVILSTAIVARTVPVSTYADWATVLSLVTMLSFALDPGLTPIVVRRITQDPHDLPSARALAAVRLAAAIGALLVVVAVSGALRGTAALALALALGAQVIPRAVVLNVGAFLQADHRLHRQTVLEAITAALGLAALAAVAALDGSAELLALAGFTIPAVLLAGLMLRELGLAPSVRRLVAGPDAARLRSVLAEVAPLAGALVLVAVYTRLHVVFVNAAEDADGVARFLFAFQFVEQLIVLAGIVAGALLPLLALRARGTALLADGGAHRAIVAVSAVGGFATAALLALADPLSRLIGGPELAASDTLLRLLAPMGAVIFSAFVLGYLLTAAQAARRYLWINLIALGVNGAAHAAFTLPYGAPAAARVSWATEAIVVALAFLPVARTGPDGFRAAARVAAVIVVAVVATEVVAAGLIAPLAGAAVCALGVALVCARELIWSARALLQRSARS